MTQEQVDEWSDDETREPYSPRTLSAMKRGEKEKNGPYQYSLRAVLKVQNGSLAPTKWSNKIGGLHTKGNFDIHALNIDLDAAMEHNGVVELFEIRGWVKSTHSKGTRQTFTLTAISIDQWEQRVESITTAEWKKYTGYIIESELVCTDRSGLRRSIQAVDGPAQSPSHRRTRTGRLEEQHAVVRDRNESLGENMEQLITRWKCHSATCGHSSSFANIVTEAVEGWSVFCRFVETDCDELYSTAKDSILPPLPITFLGERNNKVKELYCMSYLLVFRLLLTTR